MNADYFTVGVRTGPSGLGAPTWPVWGDLEFADGGVGDVMVSALGFWV